jgi:dihydrofolate reductase
MRALHTDSPTSRLIMKATVYIATSLDGFIAREDGAIDWLPPIDLTGEDYGYQAFMDSVDALVMGRNTYELVLAFEAWPYGNKPVIVLSSQPLHIPNTIAPTVEAMTASPQEVVHRLGERDYQQLY